MEMKWRIEQAADKEHFAITSAQSPAIHEQFYKYKSHLVTGKLSFCFLLLSLLNDVYSYMQEDRKKVIKKILGIRLSSYMSFVCRFVALMTIKTVETSSCA